MAKKKVKLTIKGLDDFTDADRAFVASWLRQKAFDVTYCGDNAIAPKSTIEFPDVIDGGGLRIRDAA